LDESTKKELVKLPDKERQNILVKSMQEEGLPTHHSYHLVEQPKGVYLEEDDVVSLFTGKDIQMLDKPDGADSPDNKGEANNTKIEMDEKIKAGLDLKRLVAHKAIEANKQPKVEDRPKDDWGTKLPLEGDARKSFLGMIMQFNQIDQKKLKELFDKAEPVSIQNFLSVYETGFNKGERLALLATMIYLYKGWPALTLKLCNDPNALSNGNKFAIFRKTTSSQLNLLTRLDSLLSE
jgi:hypothetical protein